MRFALSSLTTLALAVMFMPRGGNADIIAFDGSTCNGAAGDNVPCDGSCHQFTGRESFKVIPSGERCVTVYADTACNSLVSVFPNQGDSRCQNVNTGTAVGSFRCAASDTCLNWYVEFG